MKYIFPSVFLLLVLPLVDFGQNGNLLLKTKLYQADSIVIVSHLLTAVPSRNEQTGEFIKPKQLVYNGRVNEKIIKERYKLTRLEIDTLFSMLTEKYTLNEIQRIGCFMPHHGILIYQAKKISFFDICFGCRHFVTSMDLNVSDVLMESTWTKLKQYYLERGLRYKLWGIDIDQDD